MREPAFDSISSRRRFLAQTAGLAGLALTGAGARAGGSDFISSISREVAIPGRPGTPAWFHPRACLVPGGQENEVLATLQTIHGSDVFGPIHWTASRDLGRTWTTPAAIPGLGRSPFTDGLEAGVCDVVPEFHPATRTVLAIGHDVFYRNNVLARPQPHRKPVYVVRSADRTWSAPQRLEWDDPRASAIHSCGCSQRIMTADGDVLIPLTFGSENREDRLVTSVLCSFDGRSLRIRRVGAVLELRAKRGLLEPSLTTLDGRYYMTIRAEDDRGYVATSPDGLAWEPMRPWCWDDGEPLAMSTTQQHWLTHSDALFLVYTRKTDENAKVVRWRSPLFLAEVDRSSLRLIRSTERVALPIVGDARAEPARIPLMGNFHVVNASPEESWVTVGENRPKEAWWGDFLLARIRWSRPNRLVG
ncbi:sialidase family protein [Paludisphaera rhizosphaerae]|uniref:sialidase family protein n=1 Tax=Paludisphaera rhizosphaerae TaxID=2711216 RepID=UPI0013EBEF96|nr:sialidase family protein [Paludisphaera rhizosphaerae]